MPPRASLSVGSDRSAVGADRAAAARRRRQGRRAARRSTRKREIVNAILYLDRARGARGGCCRRTSRRGRRCTGTSAPGARTARSTGCTTRCASRCAPSRRSATPTPSAGIVDSQSVKGADTVSRPRAGYDAGKKINGTQAPHRHRHARAAAGRDGHRRLDPGPRRRPRDPQAAASALLPGVRHIFADGGYQGRLIAHRQARLADRRRGRQEAGRADRLRGAAPPVGRRAHLLLAAALAAARRATTNAYPRPTKRSSSGRWSASCSTGSRHHPDPGPGPPRRGENEFPKHLLRTGGCHERKSVRRTALPKTVGDGAARSIRHPLARALLALTFSTGLVDAVSYLGLGRVFTANMTGNIVLARVRHRRQRGPTRRRTARVARGLPRRLGRRRRSWR